MCAPSLRRRQIDAVEKSLLRRGEEPSAIVADVAAEHLWGNVVNRIGSAWCLDRVRVAVERDREHLLGDLFDHPVMGKRRIQRDIRREWPGQIWHDDRRVSITVDEPEAPPDAVDLPCAFETP